ncbi:uncharacterized protein [Dermacentor andersoni]|uniref:uncharacterized protein n=1 Tax=Dermacentor andersoni TaxID=34620 RepID=UPI0024172304|nr:uncharacterized protein LOC126548373 [Dermacentor andersoni]
MCPRLDNCLISRWYHPSLVIRILQPPTGPEDSLEKPETESTTTGNMVNSKVSRMVMVGVVVMVVVAAVIPVVQGKGSKAGKAGKFGKAGKAGKGPGSDAGSFGTPPPPSEDCVGVEAGPGGGASLVADPNDCTKYSVCAGMFSLKLTCPPEQHFSVADNRCTAPEQAGCDPAFAAAPADATEAAAQAEAAEAAVNVEAEPEAEVADTAEAVAEEVDDVV